MKLTKWIPGDVKPVRAGVYQRKYDKDPPARRIWYCYWNGEFWCLFDDTPEKAKYWEGFSSAVQNLPWRGLAEKPE